MSIPRLRIEHDGRFSYKVTLDDFDLSNLLSGVEVVFHRHDLPRAKLIVNPSSLELDAEVLARLEAHVLGKEDA